MCGWLAWLYTCSPAWAAVRVTSRLTLYVRARSPVAAPGGGSRAYSSWINGAIPLLLGVEAGHIPRGLNGTLAHAHTHAGRGRSCLPIMPAAPDGGRKHDL